MENQNMKTEHCTQCPKQCPKEQLSCGRGRAFFGVEETGEAGEKHGHGELAGHKGHGREHGRPDRGDNGPKYGKDLENLRPEEQTLSQLLNRCGYIAARKGSHQQENHRQEKMFNVLDSEEQKQLREILEKLLNRWMSEHGK